jgi:hypothetical protein
VIEKGLDGEVYNIGGHNERSNIEIVKTIIRTVGKPLIGQTHACRKSMIGSSASWPIGWATTGAMPSTPKRSAESWAGNQKSCLMRYSHDRALVSYPFRLVAKVTSGEYRSYYEAFTEA